MVMILEGDISDVTLEISDDEGADILCTDTLCGPGPWNVLNIDMNIEYESSGNDSQSDRDVEHAQSNKVENSHHREDTLQ
jgi:hypothetical protein